MIRFHLCLCALLFSFLGSPAQDLIHPNSTMQRADSLLLQGKVDEADILIQSLYDGLDLESPKNTSSENANNYVKTLQELKDKLKSLTTKNSNAIISIIVKNEELKNYFSIDNAGSFSFRAFKRFTTLAKENPDKNALQFYYIAYFFKKRFIYIAIYNSRILYVKADEQYHYEKHIQALDMISRANLTTEGYHQLQAIQDSLLTLKKKITIAKKRKDLYTFNWTRKGVRKNKIAVSFGTHLYHQERVRNKILTYDDNGSREKVLTYDDNGSTGKILTEYVHERYIMGYGVGINYMLTSQFSIGLYAQQATFNLTNELEQKLVFFDYDVLFTSVDFNTRYLWRPQVGLQPFVGVGFGTAKYNQKESTLTIASIEEESTPFQSQN